MDDFQNISSKVSPPFSMSASDILAFEMNLGVDEMENESGDDDDSLLTETIVFSDQKIRPEEKISPVLISAFKSDCGLVNADAKRIQVMGTEISSPSATSSDSLSTACSVSSSFGTCISDDENKPSPSKVWTARLNVTTPTSRIPTTRKKTTRSSNELFPLTASALVSSPISKMDLSRSRNDPSRRRNPDAIAEDRKSLPNTTYSTASYHHDGELTSHSLYLPSTSHHHHGRSLNGMNGRANIGNLSYTPRSPDGKEQRVISSEPPVQWDEITIETISSHTMEDSIPPPPPILSSPNNLSSFFSQPMPGACTVVSPNDWKPESQHISSTSTRFHSTCMEDSECHWQQQQQLLGENDMLKKQVQLLLKQSQWETHVQQQARTVEKLRQELQSKQYQNQQQQQEKQQQEETSKEQQSWHRPLVSLYITSGVFVMAVVSSMWISSRLLPHHHQQQTRFLPTTEIAAPTSTSTTITTTTSTTSSGDSSHGPPPFLDWTSPQHQHVPNCKSLLLEVEEKTGIHQNEKRPIHFRRIWSFIKHNALEGWNKNRSNMNNDNQ